MSLLKQNRFRIWLCLLIVASPLYATDQRPIVIEDYTATWCTFCFGVNKALVKVEETIDDVIVIEFHVDDEFSFAYTNNRSIAYDITGLPGVMFNGTVKKIGGSAKSDGFFAYNEIYNDYVETIETIREEIAGEDYFDLDVYGNIASENSELNAVISTEGYPNPVNVIFLIIQDNVEFAAANGLNEFNAMVRIHVGTEENNFSTPAEITMTKTSTEFILEEDLSNMRPVVLIQDQETNEILMAADEFSEKEVSILNWELYHDQ